jgi:hypothetical protein
MGLVRAFKNLLYFFQKPTQSNLDYHKDFLALVEVIEEYGGVGLLTRFPNMIKKELLSDNLVVTKATSDELKKAKKKVWEIFFAALMLDGASHDKYGDLKRSIQENYVTRTSEYPVSPEVVLRILNAYVPPAGWNRCMKQDGGGDSGAMFAQTDDDTWKKNITCHKCGKNGHLAWEYKSKREPDQVHANVEEKESDQDKDENIFAQHKAKGVVNKNYLLLDNQTTVNQIANPDLLTNIRKSQKPIVVHFNVGKTKTDFKGKLGDMMVHHNPKSIANVLSLHSVKQKHQVTYDSWDRDGVVVVHTPKGVVEFKPSEKGLHYIDVSKEGDSVHHMLVSIETDDETTSSDEQFVMANTVRGNFEGYTKHDIKKVQEARRLQGMIGNPTEREFEGMVREKLIANCPVTVRNIQNAHQFFGLNLANLRGKTTRTKPEHVRADYVNIPRYFMDLHKYVTIVADVMFVNGLPFLVTSSRGISLVTIKFLPSRTAKQLVNSVCVDLASRGRGLFVNNKDYQVPRLIPPPS